MINVVKILMMSSKKATSDLLKLRYFEIKVITSYILSMTSPTKIFHMTQIILWMWSYDVVITLVTLAFA